LALRGGAVYAPSALLAISGNSFLQTSLVVDKLQVSGNGGTALHADGSGTGADTAGQLLAGDLVVYVDNTSGNFTADELARVGDAIDAINLVVNPFGVAITETADRAWATTVLQLSASSAVGGAADGVLGCKDGSDITIVQGWDWYTGADPAAVGAGQYDFETAMMH